MEDMYSLYKKFPDAGTRALLGLSVTKQEPHDDDIYRVDVHPPTHIQVICFGIDRLDSTVEGVYDNINDLPNWMQERLSVLSMLPPNTSGGNDVKGIGRRITESIYWIYAQK
jgi:hypothetical protein